MNIFRSICPCMRSQNDLGKKNDTFNQGIRTSALNPMGQTDRVDAVSKKTLASDQFVYQEDILHQKELTIEDADIFYNKGLDFFEKGKLTEALEQYQKDLAIRERLAPNSFEVARSCSGIGGIYEAQDKLVEALEHYQKCLVIEEQLFPNSWTLANSYKTIGQVYKAQGKLVEALEHYQKCLVIAEQFLPNSRTLVDSYDAIGQVYEAQGKLVEALEHYQKDLVIAEQLFPNSWTLARSYNAIGQVYKAQGKLVKAIEQYQECLAIQERLAPDSLIAATSANNIGLLYQSQGKLTEALELFQKSLAIHERLAPDSLNVATSANNIGTIYLSQGNLTEALEQFQKGLAIHERLAPDSLNAASIANNIGMIYLSQGKLTEALELFQKSLAIHERLAPNSLNVATSANNIGTVYLSQGKLTEALEQFQKSLAIQERLAPDSLNVATFGNNIGRTYLAQGKLTEALERFQKSLAIQERLAPDSLNVAGFTNNIGLVYQSQGKLTEALGQFQKSLAIRERLAPDSLNVATSANNIGLVYQSQGKLAEALEQFQKSLAIRERDLIPQHPELLSLGNQLALTALGLGDYSNAFTYVRKIINNDPTYKYAFDTLGLILHKQGNHQDALSAFDRALSCDPGYADASIHRLEVLSDLETIQVEMAKKEFLRAQKTQKTDYDERKKEELRRIALTSAPKGGGEKTEIELPKQEYVAGTVEYLEMVDALRREVEAKFAIRDERISDLNFRVNKIEQRLDLFDGQVLGLKDSLSAVARAMAFVDQKMADMNAVNPLFQELTLEKKRLKERETYIKTFNRNNDLRHYFYALLSELEAAYLAAQVIETGKLTEESTTKYSKAAGYVGSFLELVPYAGQIASKLVTGVAGMADTYFNIKTKAEFMRIRDLAPTLEEYNQITLRVAVILTLKNRDTLVNLKGAKVPHKWQTGFESITSTLEHLLPKFLIDNGTQAKVLGRLDAYKVLAHLQEEAVAENYAIFEPETSSASQRKYSLIGQEIVTAI